MNAVWTGILYILGTVFGILSGVIGGETLSSFSLGKPLVGVDLLELVAANATRIASGAFLILMMGISLSTMTVFLYPVLRKDSEELATGMVLFRGAIEGVFYLLSTLGFLAMAVVGTLVDGAGVDSTVLHGIASFLYQFQGRIAAAGTLFFLIGAVCLYVSFYRTRLIPRWLTIWGLIGVVAYMASTLLKFFNLDSGFGFYLEMVLAPQEMVMAAWLIIKGFNKTAIKTLLEKSAVN
jgi:hypothetical protein